MTVVLMAGLLLSFSQRWEASATACALLPYSSFVVGRMPTPKEYPFPYASVIPGLGRLVERSDKFEMLRRTISVHVWVDPYKLEDGEEIMEMVRQLYASQAFCYDFGQVVDILDGGPPHPIQVNDPTFQAWELVKLLTLCIWQPRVDDSLICECPPPLCVGFLCSIGEAVWAYDGRSLVEAGEDSPDSPATAIADAVWANPQRRLRLTV